MKELTPKKTYKIPYSWEVYGKAEVEADSLQDAIDIVESDEFPLPQGDYVDASFRVDHDIIHEMNEED